MTTLKFLKKISKSKTKKISKTRKFSKTKIKQNFQKKIEFSKNKFKNSKFSEIFKNFKIPKFSKHSKTPKVRIFFLTQNFHCSQLLSRLQRHSSHNPNSNGLPSKLASSRANISRFSRAFYGANDGKSKSRIILHLRTFASGSSNTFATPRKVSAKYLIATLYESTQRVS